MRDAPHEVELTHDELISRDEYLFNAYADLSKRKGDYWFRKATEISGDGDYTPGIDDGEPPRGADRE